MSSIVWFIIQYPLKIIQRFRSRNSNATVPIPEIFNEYSSKLKKNWPIIRSKLTQLHTSQRSLNFDFDLAEFHLLLSALAYQSDPVIQEVIQTWGGDIEFIRFGHEGME